VDTLMIVFFGLIGLIIFVMGVVVPLFQRRCPRCGSFRGAKGNHALAAAVESTSVEFDTQIGRSVDVTRTDTGRLVTYHCRACHHTWERLHTSTDFKRTDGHDVHRM